MGKKTRRKVRTRPKPKLPDIFQCPQCSEEAVRIDINKKTRTATVACGNCQTSEEIYNVKTIFEKVDIYGIWIDNYYQRLSEEQYEDENPSDTSKEGKDS